LKSLGDQGILLACNVGAARASEVENPVYVSRRLRASKIARDEATKILCKGYPEIGGSLPCPPLNLRFKRNLCLCHHDGYIIPYPVEQIIVPVNECFFILRTGAGAEETKKIY
jgi:hypothetical protein